MKRIFVFLMLFAGMSSPAIAQLDRVEGREAIVAANHTVNRVTFKPGTAEMEPGSEKMLERLRKYLADKPEVTLMRIEAHVEESDSATNQKLSEARALAVVHWLVGAGIDCKRLIAAGFGDSKPVMALSDKRNTRINYINVAMSGKPIGSRPADGGGKIAGDPCR